MFIKTTPISEATAHKAQVAGHAAEQDATPSERILMAVEMIGLRGPLTYKELERALNLSKAATWRLVATLRDAQWVRFRQNGRLIELDPRVDELFATAHFADAEFLEVAEVIADVAGRHQVHIDLFSHNRRGDLVLQETSRRLTAAAPVHDVTDENMVMAIHAAMTPPQLERHLSQAAVELDGENRPQFTVGAARRRIQQFPGYFWGAGGRHLGVSVRGKMGTATVLRISAKANAVRPDLLAQAYVSLAVLMHGKVESFGAGRASVDLP
jgi:DNA-binding IclR family transcriptional regulator